MREAGADRRDSVLCADENGVRASVDSRRERERGEREKRRRKE